MLKRERAAREVLLMVLDGEDCGSAEHGEAGGQSGELECGRHYVGVVFIGWLVDDYDYSVRRCVLDLMQVDVVLDGSDWLLVATVYCQ